MKKRESIHMPLPQNLPFGEHGIKKIRKIINTALELGGTVYQVAVDSGLLSAYHFMDLTFDEEITRKRVQAEDMVVVTEVYVCYPETEETERVFLYSNDASLDNRLLEEGRIQEGKLLIEYAKLKTLYEKGYHCICPNRSGRLFVAFGERYKRTSVLMWDEDFSFVGNGFNQALLVYTGMGAYFVMPDVYAVSESIKVVYAENLIREKYVPTFCIERIESYEAAADELPDVRCRLFGREELEICDSYQRLTEQVAYIKKFYPEVYKTVWVENYVPEDEGAEMKFELDEATLAISLDANECFAVCRMKDGSVRRIPNMDVPVDIPLWLKYAFRGCGDMRNAGVAGSGMALTMKSMLQTVGMLYDVEITKVAVTCLRELPTASEISGEMKRRRLQAERMGNAETNVDLIAYREIEDKNPDGLGIIKWATEMAGISRAEYVDEITARVGAFEKADESYCLKEGEIALLYDFNEMYLVLALVRKKKDGQLEVIERAEEWAPEIEILDERDLEEGDINPGLAGVLGNSLKEFMLSSGLMALGIFGEDKADKEAFKDLYKSVSQVCRQLRRNDTAKVCFDNGWLSMVEDYPIELFENCFAPILAKNEKVLREFLEKAGVVPEEIGKLYLSGTETEYPFVRKNVEEIVQRKACCVNASECVAARGAVGCV